MRRPAQGCGARDETLSFPAEHHCYGEWLALMTPKPITKHVEDVRE
jgi:hypothetical protein